MVAVLAATGYILPYPVGLWGIPNIDKPVFFDISYLFELITKEYITDGTHQDTPVKIALMPFDKLIRVSIISLECL
jgi:hypothetical protein